MTVFSGIFVDFGLLMLWILALTPRRNYSPANFRQLCLLLLFFLEESGFSAWKGCTCASDNLDWSWHFGAKKDREKTFAAVLGF